MCTSQEMVLSWSKDVKIYQLSNSKLIHRKCILETDDFIVVPEYTTGDLDETEFRTEA